MLSDEAGVLGLVPDDMSDQRETPRSHSYTTSLANRTFSVSSLQWSGGCNQTPLMPLEEAGASKHDISRVPESAISDRPLNDS